MVNILNSASITSMAKALFAEKRAGNRLDGWFIAKEAELALSKEYEGMNEEIKKATILREICRTLPIYLSDYQIFAGTQDDGFARSYALINPTFKVETFAGYCDPTAVYDDITVTEEFTKERIETLREIDKNTPYVKSLTEVYSSCENLTGVASWRCVRPLFTISSFSASRRLSVAINVSIAGKSLSSIPITAAMCIAVGNVSLEDWLILMSSLGCSSFLPAISLPRFAITSFAFMLDCVPDPVCQTTRGKCSFSLLL